MLLWSVGVKSNTFCSSVRTGNGSKKIVIFPAISRPPIEKYGMRVHIDFFSFRTTYENKVEILKNKPLYSTTAYVYSTISLLFFYLIYETIVQIKIHNIEVACYKAHWLLAIV